ncbi:hypothetical protein M0813_12983 [Anaeramoeba flamelloides]|uniref:Uncharacterized protein n=1 Tax=Anaeramoeba flamelloides TaxID=1746091 RepID=A0ABQ8ZA36_9EUKA|nr:hypothetical protein M0813_12983 [Anaeramoeba flamelloides]
MEFKQQSIIKNKKFPEELGFTRQNSGHKTLSSLSKTDLHEMFLDEQIIRFIEKEKQCLYQKHEKKIHCMKKLSQTQKKKLEDEITILQDQLTRRNRAVETSSEITNKIMEEKQILFEQNEKLLNQFEELQKRNQALEEKNSKLKKIQQVNKNKQRQTEKNINKTNTNSKYQHPKKQNKYATINKSKPKSPYRNRNRNRIFSLSNISSDDDHERVLNNKNLNNFRQRSKNFPKSNSVSELDFQIKRKKNNKKRHRNMRGSWKDWFGVSNKKK